jgi:hypothetical protein
MLHYPVDFPADAGRVIVTAWTSGTLLTKSADVVEAAWNLAGYAMKEILGETQPNTADPNIKQSGGMLSMQGPQADALVMGSLNGQPIDDEEMIQLLKSHDELTPGDKLKAGLPIPVETLLKWSLGLVMKILSGMIAA